MNSLPASRDLRKLLEQAQKDYQANLDNLTDAATDQIETAIQRGDLDLKELVNEYARDASQLANDYYDQLRGLWAESSEPMPEFLHDKLVDPERVLWQVEHGFSNTDFNGLTYQQVMEGRARSGVTIDDLWPPLDNIDDAQQFIADMIAASGRLTMQRNIKLDPTKPKWARVCGRIWAHILDGDSNGKGGHAPWSNNHGKTKFPDDWDEKKIKWAIREAIAAPDEETQSPRPNTKELVKEIEGIRIRVRMNHRKNGWRVNTAFPDIEDKRGVNS